MTASINIFSMPRVVTLTLGGNTGAAHMNYPVNRTDFKLIKGITNEILFFVKDTDRHPITTNNLSNSGISNIRIIVSDPTNSDLLLGSNDAAPMDLNDPSILVPATGIDPAKGVWLLTLKGTDTANWPIGHLRYSVVCDRSSGDQVMLYTDRNYGPYGSLEMISGPFPNPPEAITITPADCLTLGQSLYSGPFRGAAFVGNLSGQHGVVAHLDQFVGSISVQASLENQVPVHDSDWFDANISEFSLNSGQQTATQSGSSTNFPDPTTGQAYLSLLGNYMWVRFIVHTALGQPGVWTSIDFRAN